MHNFLLGIAFFFLSETGSRLAASFASPLPTPFSLIFHRQATPTTYLNPTPTPPRTPIRTRTPLRKIPRLPPIKTTPLNQKKPNFRNFSARNSSNGAGNGCADFMGAWNFWALSAEKLPCKIQEVIVCFFGGRGGGAEVPILFLWARRFF